MQNSKLLGSDWLMSGWFAWHDLQTPQLVKGAQFDGEAAETSCRCGRELFRLRQTSGGFFVSR